MNQDLFELRLEALHEIQEIGGEDVACARRWRSEGNDPAWSCSWPKSLGSTLAGGWYLLDLSAYVHAGCLHNMRLYPDYGRGRFVEADGLPLAMYAKKGNSASLSNALVRLADNATALRLDPSVIPCDFTIDPIRMRRIGRLEALRFLFRDQWDSSVSKVKRLRMFAAAGRDLLVGGPRKMGDRLFQRYMRRRADQTTTDYTVWLDFYDTMDEQRSENVRRDLDALPHKPVISVIVPVYNAPEQWLRRCIESVLEQAYPEWQLCLANDASTEPHIADVLAEYEHCDPRVRVVHREVNGHISEASNSALELATGDYVALLDHDDELHPLALLECAKAFIENAEWRMLYTDEDKIDTEGKRSDPYFKSDWNPDLFLSQNCVCHLTVYERELVRTVGGFRKGMEGAQDWDLTLRVAEHLKKGEIGHVPKVMYHWRMIEGSTALAPGEKSYAHLAAMRAIQEHLDRTGRGAKVEEMPGYSGYYHIAHPIPQPAPKVTLLIPTRDRADLLRQCIDSIIARTTYPTFEIVVIDNGSEERETHAYFESLQSLENVTVLPYNAPFNYSAINNFGASRTDGEIIGLLNNDIEVIEPGWLSEMVSHAVRPEIGVVGAMLYYPNDTIQHAGVVLGIGGVAGHMYVGMPKGFPGDKHRAGLTQNLSAVTAACALVRREVFEEVGGLDEKLQVAFNDVDFCIRVREAGYRNLWTPFAELYHHESASRGYENTPEKIARFKREEKFMQERWGKLLDYDPYYNPNFSVTSTPFTFAYPPRDAKPRAQASVS